MTTTWLMLSVRTPLPSTQSSKVQSSTGKISSYPASECMTLSGTSTMIWALFQVVTSCSVALNWHWSGLRIGASALISLDSITTIRRVTKNSSVISLAIYSCKETWAQLTRSVSLLITRSRTPDPTWCQSSSSLVFRTIAEFPASAWIIRSIRRMTTSRSSSSWRVCKCSWSKSKNLFLTHHASKASDSNPSTLRFRASKSIWPNNMNYGNKWTVRQSRSSTCSMKTGDGTPRATDDSKSCNRFSRSFFDKWFGRDSRKFSDVELKHPPSKTSIYRPINIFVQCNYQSD